jgi:Protein of unknown function (DUF4239)
MLLAAAILIASVAAAIGLIVLMRSWAPDDGAFFRDFSAAGGVFGAVRGPLAVLLAFVIFLAFQGYTRADTSARNEASAVLTISRTADIFPPASADDIQKDMVCYARTVIEDEWPAMQDGGESELIDHWLFESEQAISRLQIQGATQEQALAEFFAESNVREEMRDDRLAEADGVVPTPVWIVLILGGLCVVGYVAFFADRRERLLPQAMMIGVTTAVITTGLLLVAFFDHPYADRPGSLKPTAMESTLERMELDRQAEPFATEPPCDESGSPQSEEFGD